jgi:hypothetical protein
VIATIGTWSRAALIRSGANTLLSAMASQRPPTAIAAGSSRPVRWSRWTSSVVCVSTSVAVMRSPPLLDALASATPWQRYDVRRHCYSATLRAWPEGPIVPCCGSPSGHRPVG